MIPTKAKLLTFKPCHEARAFIARHRTAKALWQNCQNPEWLLWALDRFDLLDKDKVKLLQFTILCAEHVLPHWENQHDDPQPRRAIEAARRCLTAPSAAASSAASLAADAAWRVAWSVGLSTTYAARSATNAAYVAARVTSDAVWGTAWSSPFRLAADAAEAARSAIRSAAYNTQTAQSIEDPHSRAAWEAAERAEEKWQADTIRTLFNPFDR